MKGKFEKIGKYKYVICLILLICSFICSCFFVNKKESYDIYSFNGIDENTSQVLANENGDELKKVIDSSDIFKKINLKNKDRLIQNFWNTSLSIKKIQMMIDVNDVGNSMVVLLLNENGKEIYNDNIELLPQKLKYTLDINSDRYQKYDKFTLKLKLNIKEKSKVSIYSCTYHDGSLKINGKSQEDVLLTGTEGLGERYRSKIIFSLAAIEVLLIIFMLFFNYLDNGITKKVTLILNKKKLWIFVGEWFVTSGLILFMLKIFCDWYYKVAIQLPLYFLAIIFAALYLFIMIILFLNMKEKIENIFILLSIPIGLCFTFLILPGSVPDEPVHFAKAYLTSQFNFSFTTHLKITSQFVTTEIRNYNDILPAIFKLDHYKTLVPYNIACAYHFILYIFSALPLLLTRLLGLSVFLGYYCGRMMNLMAFIAIGYYILKIVPFGKWVFFVYFFNPVLLQQSMSYSSDSLINTVCLLAIAYFLKLKFSEENIQNKDIIIVFLLIGIILLAKYIYLPLFGIYFLLFDKLKNMKYKQWLLCVLMILLIGLVYYGTDLLKVNAKALESLDNYVKENNVNQGSQISFLLSNPKNIIKMYIETLKNKSIFYFNSFIGMLGVLAIPLNCFSYFGYYGLMVTTPLLLEDANGNKIKKCYRVWFVFVTLALISLIILGMYFQWTPVGTFITEGVQGRYFIPVIIIFLLSLVPLKKKISINMNIIIPIYLSVVEILVFVDVIRYFM